MKKNLRPGQPEAKSSAAGARAEAAEEEAKEKAKAKEKEKEQEKKEEDEWDMTERPEEQEIKVPAEMTITSEMVIGEMVQTGPRTITIYAQKKK